MGLLGLAGNGGITGGGGVGGSGTVTSVSAGNSTIVISGNPAVNPSVAVGTGIPEASITNLTTDLASKANDASVVHLAGTETISGAKTFSNGAGVVISAGGLSLSSTAEPLLLQGAAGTAGQVLTSGGAATTPSWTTISSGGAGLGAPAFVLGTTNVQGASANAVPLDSTLAFFDATVPGSISSGAAAATGSVAFASRRDHTHGAPVIVSSIAAASAKVVIGGSATAPTVDVGTGIPESSITNLTTDLAAKLGNVLTTTGDLIYSSAATTAARLGIGATNQVLTVVGGIPAWAAAASGFANPMTTLGDIITAAGGGTAQRLGVGSNNQVLTVVSGTPAWAAASGGGVATVTAGDGTITIGGTSVNPTVAVASIAESQVTGLTSDLFSKINSVTAGSANIVVTTTGMTPNPKVDLAANISVTTATAANGMTISAGGLTVNGGNITTANGSQIGPAGGSFTVKSGANTSNLNLATGANNVLVLTGVASAVNSFSMTSSIATNRVILATTGTDTNIGLNLSLKGTGDLAINGNPGAAGQVLTSNGATASPTWTTAGAGTVTSVTGTSPIVITGTPTSTPNVTLSSVLGTTGTDQQIGTAVTGQLLSPALGTAGTPDTSLNPALKVSRLINITGAVAGDGSTQLNAIMGISSGVGTNTQQPVGLFGAALNAGTGDTVGVYGYGSHTGTGIGAGGFFNGLAASATAKANGMQVNANNGTGSDQAVNATGQSNIIGIWLTTNGGKMGSAAVEIGGGNTGTFGWWDTGIHIPNQANTLGAGPIKTAVFLDDSTAAAYGIRMNGAHSSAALAFAAGSGPALFGGVTQQASPALFEVQGANVATDPLVFFGSTANTRTYTQRLRNASGTLILGIVGVAGQLLSDSAVGDSVLFGNGSGKVLRISAGTATTSELALSQTVLTATVPANIPNIDPIVHTYFG